MSRFFPSTGHSSAWWPVLLLLLIVLVPSAGVVWLMRAAMENERLAVRQRLVDAYHAQLEIVRDRIEADWSKRLVRLDAIAGQQSPSQAFAECVHERLADSVIILDGSGHVVYPTAGGSAAAEEPSDEAWVRARELEFSLNNPAAAADAYQQIAGTATDAGMVARARQAEARVRLRAGDQDGAIAALREVAKDSSATDAQGRSLAADAELRLIELLDADSPERVAIIDSLVGKLRNYDPPVMPSNQRRFLIGALASVEPNAGIESSAAEDLAADYVANMRGAPRREVLMPTSAIGISQIRSPSGRVVALYTAGSLDQETAKRLAEQPLPDGVRVAVQHPSSLGSRSDEVVSVGLAPTMPGWRLSLSLADDSLFDKAASQRMTSFVWAGLLVVAITAALAILAGGVLRRQLRLTRLKNDLVANVSHELKTPLASIRLLVDTLLEADESPNSPARDPVQARQYLELIAQENARLSRLIDNFLTFSRMERGRQRFDFAPADAAAIVDRAVAAVVDRFAGPTHLLEVDVTRPLPIVGDEDALVAVVVNLLDNAWKYTTEPKRVLVRADRQVVDGEELVVISVKDNGVGLAPRAMRKVFDRFYQVDQRLSRTQGGCGLGLSIVKYIVEAHDGEVLIESQLREGSTFTVVLPAAMLTDERIASGGAVLNREKQNSAEQHPAEARS